MTTPTPTDSDHGSTVATPDRKRQHAAPSQPDLAAKSRRRNGRQERAVRPRRRRPRRGDLDSREAGATIIEVRWEGASANTAHATPRRQGRRRNPARTPLRSSLRTETNEAPHSPQRWVGKRDRSVANSETPQPRTTASRSPNWRPHSYAGTPARTATPCERLPLLSRRGRGIEADVLRFGRHRRAAGPAIDACRGDSREEPAVKPRILGAHGPVAALEILDHADQRATQKAIGLAELRHRP